MKLRSFSIFALLFSFHALAEEKSAESARSPDGNVEFRISRQRLNDDPNGYGLHIYRVKPEKQLFTLPNIGGYLRYNAAIERDHGFWHSSSQFIAITDQGSRHSRELYIAHIDGEKVTLLKQPDFYQNALGRVGAVEIDFASVVTPEKWDGDDLILKLYFTANGRTSYTFAVKLHLDQEPHIVPRLSLKSVEKLKEEKG